MKHQFEGLKFYTPEKNQGQMIEVSYAWSHDPEGIIVRAADRQTQSVSYRLAQLADGADWDGWGCPELAAS